MIVDALVKRVRVIEEMIKDLNFAMRHASPYSVNELRRQKEELEAVYEELMESCVVSNFDLEYMLGKHDQCIRECFRPVYTGQPVILPKPKWDFPPPPPEPEVPLPTVPGVNLILYIDSSGSMRGALSRNGQLRKELEAFANYLKSESSRANIPCTVSLIWFGDASEGDGRNTYYTIAMNKESVTSFPDKVSSPKWYRGGRTIPESGILAMKETLPQVVKSGVANTLIYITDAPSREEEFGATPTQVLDLLREYDVTAYGIYPTNKGPDIGYLFSDERHYNNKPFNIIPWADATLRPEGG